MYEVEAPFSHSQTIIKMSQIPPFCLVFSSSVAKNYFSILVYAIELLRQNLGNHMKH